MYPLVPYKFYCKFVTSSINYKLYNISVKHQIKKESHAPLFLQICQVNGYHNPFTHTHTHSHKIGDSIKNSYGINHILIATTPFNFHDINITVQVL
jgi:hypothetical protein